MSRELRFLITQRCNYDCSFCHGEGLQSVKKDLLTADDISFLYSVGRDFFDVSTTTLTGGEPLIRNDIEEITKKLKNESCNITITTNGSLLGKHINVGKYIKGINVSLHTLNSKNYEEIVRRNKVFEVLISNLKIFREIYPDVGICLNIALVKDINSSEEELNQLILFAESIGASIKFIELFPPYSEGFVPLEYLKNYLLNNSFVQIPSATRKEKFYNGKTEVGLIKIFCAKACETDNPADYCNRNNDLFISPDGKIKPCRNDITEVDVLDAIKDRNIELTKNGIDEAFKMLGKKCVYKRR